MSPVKVAAHNERLRSAALVLDILERPLLPGPAWFDHSQARDHLSAVKGLFNRVAREDQWDWFTVKAQLGYPSDRLSRVIAEQLSGLRSAIVHGDRSGFIGARDRLRRLPLDAASRCSLGGVRLQMSGTLGGFTSSPAGNSRIR